MTPTAVRPELATKFSIREILAIIFFIALAISACRWGGLVAIIFTSCAAALIVANLIVAQVAKGAMQAFGQGFSTPVLWYIFLLGLLAMTGVREFNPKFATLPTSKLSRFFFESVRRPVHIDMDTGEIVPPDEAEAALAAARNRTISSFGGMPHARVTSGPRNISPGERPDRAEFMVAAHAFWMILLGWIGGRFALTIRRLQDPS